MAFLRDWTFIEDATRIPALSEIVREALIRAAFVRDDRVLPAEIIAALSRAPAVTVKVKDDGEIRKLLRVLNGEESTVSLGLSAEDFHYFRQQVGVARGQVLGVTIRPRALLTYDWIVPGPKGVQLDFSNYREVDIPEKALRALAQVGAPWKDLYDAATAKGRLVPFVPTVPLDFAIGDALWADAPLGSYDGPFASYVQALRTVSGYGHRTRLGFEEVSSEGTGYDLLHAVAPYVTEFFVPVAVSFRIASKPAARRTLTYGFDDPAKLSGALDRLTRSGRNLHWAHVTDAAASTALRPTVPAGPFTLQVSFAAPETSLPAREKAFDGLLAGFASKASDLPNPFDVPADLYQKNAERVGRALFVGEVVLPAASLGDLHAKVKGLAEQKGVKTALYASVRRDGTASAFPAFDAPKDRLRTYELSRGVYDLAKKIPGALFVSRLAHLWEEGADYRRRVDLLRRLKSEVDASGILEPTVTV